MRAGHALDGSVAAGASGNTGAAASYETVIVATPDLTGRLVGKRVTGRHFATSADTRTCDVIFGWGVAHQLIEGLAGIGWEHGYGDVVTRPDPATMRPVAWWPRTGLVMADAVRPDGAAIPFAPRTVLRRQVEAARALGLEPLASSELEFTVFAETPASLAGKGFSALRLHREFPHPQLVETAALDEDLLGEVRAAMEASGIPVESLKAEYSASQFELTLAPAPALEAADRHAIYKLGVRELCRRHGLEATFMAKWHEERGGQSCHLHVSLADPSGNNLFGEGDDGPMMHFLGGLQRYAPDVFLLWAPYANSYKRLRPGTFAPASVSWGGDNRTVALRVVGEGPGRHVENRIPGGDVNPYLAHAALLAAGLAGIREQLDPDDGVGHENAYARSGVPRLPDSVEEAVELFCASEAAAEAFGADVVAHLGRFAADELDACRFAVTDVERRRLFHL